VSEAAEVPSGEELKNSETTETNDEDIEELVAKLRK